MILRGVGVGATVQLTISKCSPPMGDSVSDSDSSMTPVNVSSNDTIVVTNAFSPGIPSLCLYCQFAHCSSVVFFVIMTFTVQFVVA